MIMASAPEDGRHHAEGDSAPNQITSEYSHDVREKAARQFSARLTGRGFESWVREGNDTYVVGGQEYMPQDLVVVRALDAAGNPVSAEVNVDIATFNLYPDTLTGGAVHGTHQTFAPMAPPVSLGYLLTGRSPER